jgi:hypothetical protein
MGESVQSSVGHKQQTAVLDAQKIGISSQGVIPFSQNDRRPEYCHRKSGTFEGVLKNCLALSLVKTVIPYSFHFHCLGGERSVKIFLFEGTGPISSDNVDIGRADMDEMTDMVAECFYRGVAILRFVGDHVYNDVEYFAGKPLIEILMIGPVAMYSANSAAKIIRCPATIEEGNLVTVLE